jgi:branched-chain amino acid transport system permease protein
MFEIFGLPSQALFGQLLLGLINGSFYALLSLGLAVIFGMLNIINFSHGAQYMMGAFAAYLLLQYAGMGYWPALFVASIAVGVIGILIERNLVAQLKNPSKSRTIVLLGSTIVLFLAFSSTFNPVPALSIAIVGGFLFAEIWAFFRPELSSNESIDHLYGLLLTFGMALIIEGLFRIEYGSSGQPYQVPATLQGGRNLGFMFLPNYRAWVIVFSLTVCLATWFAIERTRLGSYLRAATENPVLVRAFGINVPRMVTLTYGFGVGLAALAGVMAAPIYNVSPQMGSDLIIVVFAVVVIGGMGSIMGAIVTGFALGLVEGLTKVFFPEASNTVIFVIMAIVLLIRPAGLFGRHA